ncbi:MAG: helix-hairpin-helix domain-containing protein [Polyangiales bacterium]|nr:helix-hairpin-helix domain-containing protein [Myxococcales bacterium]
MTLKRIQAFLTPALLAAALLVPISASAEPGKGNHAPTAAGSTEAPTVAGVVNLNTATEAELMALPGVGATRAGAIVAQRKQKPFARIEDVIRVKGIGRATFRKLRANLAVSGPTTLKPATPAARATKKPTKP